ncbi:MAG: hypothetical protein PWQ62_551 [Candidatus Methanomethylophilaceae archaeon]|nr:hypothetical protein [Candidatus Methanomethylophilaceae archaeon]
MVIWESFISHAHFIRQRIMADLEKLIKDGHKEMEKGDFKKAYNKFKKAAEEFLDNSEIWFLKAETGNMASGMFGAKIPDEEIIDAYKRAIELDPENFMYYSSYGSFCISVGEYEEAEGAYKEAAELDDANAGRYLSEFAVEYYNSVLARYGEIMDDPKAREPYARKALQFMLMALDMDADEAKRLLE